MQKVKQNFIYLFGEAKGEIDGAYLWCHFPVQQYNRNAHNCTPLVNGH